MSDLNTSVTTITVCECVDMTSTVYAKKEKGTCEKTKFTKKMLSLSEGTLLYLLCMNDEKSRALSDHNEDFTTGALFKAFHHVKTFKGVVCFVIILRRGTTKLKVKSDHCILLAGESEKQTTKQVSLMVLLQRNTRTKQRQSTKVFWQQ